MLTALVLILGLPLVMIVKGLVLSTLWSWFVVPLGMDPISIPAAIGLSLTLSLFTGMSETGADTETPPEALGYLFGYGVFVPLLLLFIGWVLTLFM